MVVRNSSPDFFAMQFYRATLKLMTHTPEIGAESRRRFFVPDAIWYEKIGAENQHGGRKN